MCYIFQGDDGIPGLPGPKGIRVSDICCISHGYINLIYIKFIGSGLFSIFNDLLFTPF